MESEYRRDGGFVVIYGRRRVGKTTLIKEFMKGKPAFPSILQNAWDELLKDSNTMLIVCGSLLGMMQKHALSYDSPLYGRRTARLRLAPLSFTEGLSNTFPISP